MNLRIKNLQIISIAVYIKIFQKKMIKECKRLHVRSLCKEQKKYTKAKETLEQIFKIKLINMKIYSLKV